MQFQNFDAFREAFWSAVSQDPALTASFNADNIARMAAGKAPYAIGTQQVGGRMVYELDHVIELQNGGPVYDMNNLFVRTPLNHIYGK